MSQNQGNPGRNLTGSNTGQQFIPNSQQQQTQQQTQQQKQQQYQLIQQLQQSGINIPPQVLQNPNLLHTYLNLVLHQKQQGTNGPSPQNPNVFNQQLRRRMTNVNNASSSSTRQYPSPNNPLQGKLTGTKRPISELSDQEQMKRLRAVYEQRYPQAMKPDYKTKFSDFEDLRTRLNSFQVFESTFNPLSEEEQNKWREKLSSTAENFLKHKSKLETHFDRRLKRLSEAEFSMEEYVFIERLLLQSDSESIKSSVEKFARQSKEYKQKYIGDLQRQQQVLRERRQKHERQRSNQQQKKEIEKQKQNQQKPSSSTSKVSQNGWSASSSSSASPVSKATASAPYGSPIKMEQNTTPSPSSQAITPQPQSSPARSSTPISTPQSHSNSPALKPTPPPQTPQQQPYMQSNTFGASQPNRSSPVTEFQQQFPQQNSQNQIAQQLLSNMTQNNPQSIRPSNNHQLNQLAGLSPQQIQLLLQKQQLYQKQQTQQQQPFPHQQIQQQQNSQPYVPTGGYQQPNFFPQQSPATTPVSQQQQFWNSGSQTPPLEGSPNMFGNMGSVAGQGTASYTNNTSFSNSNGTSQQSSTSQQQSQATSSQNEEENSDLNIQDFFA